MIFGLILLLLLHTSGDSLMLRGGCGCGCKRATILKMASVGNQNSKTTNIGGGVVGRARLNNRDKRLKNILEETDFVRNKTPFGEDGTAIVPLNDDPSVPMVKSIVRAADKRKAGYISAMRISHLTEVTTFMIVVEGNSRPQNQAIALSVEEDVLLGFSLQPSKQGNAASGWIVLDYGSIIVHVMTPQMRNFYKLERRWKDSETLDLTTILNYEQQQTIGGSSRRDDLNKDDEQNVSQVEVEVDEEDPFWK